MTPYSSPLPAPAKRLVLFVADGLRADKFFEVNYAGESNSPYLRDIITNIGAWGVSHTRVPTESRPGHVALIGGIYEDVSAVTKGWKENPVEFDSVFNESRYTWAWGSPDILPMFSKGSRKNVFIDTYTSAEEDFAAAKPHSLDVWVFDKLEKFLNDARTNATLKNMLWQDKNILFLHLLGMDISGHSYKPGSQEYIKNMQVVDTGIQKCVDLIDSFFEGDGKTAYVFTSDHGMTDWGSHGSGDMQETYTPLVAWGAGVRGPLGEGKDFYHDGLSAEWKLAQVKRVDVNQVDIAPLISALIGIPFPVNSLGILPVEYLGTDWPHKALSLLTNARQILANYQRQMLQKKENTLPVFFWRFKELSPNRQAELMSMIDTLLKQNRYKDVIQVGLKIIELALKGLTYYQKHDRIALSLSIFLAFLGWISYVFVLILRDYTTVGQKSLESSIIIPDENFSRIKCILSFIFVGALISILLYVQNAPSMYYAYFLLPVLLWMLVCLEWDLIYSAKLHLERKNVFYKFVGLTILSFIAMEFLVNVK
ncbi:GPI ethanolamine phosphate transferase 1 [Trichonephila clavata]|uniref:GPI ethanolamine phosphate transferase 1 n=1 Tax=Trichonephila clavata TaxID=2740835 RepID=A0A8X6GBP8_TRICU|nr:GPI ethanolamine phosphate transferase 1 [Trichonephila clavata]